MLRIAVLISGGGTNLQALIDAQDEVLVSGRIEFVVSNTPHSFGLKRAQKHGIPTAVIEKSAEAFEEELIALLEKERIDIIVLAGFLRILSADFTKRYEGRIINVHPSLIPSFCGKGLYGIKVHEAALRYGVKVTGATVHYVNEVPDGGRIILQKAVDVHEYDTPEILQRRVMEEAEWVILPQAAELVCQKWSKA